MASSWSATDDESGIQDYQYAVGTAIGDTDVLNWMDAGKSTGLSTKRLSMKPGKKYYVSVKARNGAGAWGQAGSSRGSLVSTTQTVGDAKKCADGTIVGVKGGRVTAAFGDCIYIE